MKRILSLVLVVLSFATYAQQKPKLVVGIVVDQMRADYLYRYWDRFGEGGFKELVNNGSLCANAHYNYTPTFTGPGHASIFTGTTPSYHGIVSNDWWDRVNKRDMYCVQDDDVKPIGTESKKAKRSPKNLISSNLADELELNVDMETARERVYGMPYTEWKDKHQADATSEQLAAFEARKTR